MKEHTSSLRRTRTYGFSLKQSRNASTQCLVILVSFSRTQEPKALLVFFFIYKSISCLGHLEKPFCPNYSIKIILSMKIFYAMNVLKNHHAMEIYHSLATQVLSELF